MNSCPDFPTLKAAQYFVDSMGATQYKREYPPVTKPVGMNRSQKKGDPMSEDNKKEPSELSPDELESVAGGTFQNITIKTAREAGSGMATGFVDGGVESVDSWDQVIQKSPPKP
jgi:hypothetical protein